MKDAKEYDEGDLSALYKSGQELSSRGMKGRIAAVAGA
jgi:hypothetical protein